MAKSIFLFLMILFGLSCTPKPKNSHFKYIMDREEILTDSEEKELNTLLTNHEDKTTNEIVIYTTSNYGSDTTLFDHSLAVANSLQVGKKDKNNGVLIAVSRAKRNVRIQNGYGIETILSDRETKLIIDSLMIPHFKNDSYYIGIKAGTEAIIEHLEQRE